jgi:prefoldin subunit 5
LRFGRAPWWSAPAGPPAQEQESEALKAQAGWLQQQLDAINKRIEELDQEAK